MIRGLGADVVDPDPADLMAIARRAALEGGEAARRARASRLAVRRKADGTTVTAADLAAESAILEVLRAGDPDAAICCEESGEHPGRASRTWIVDPLDGTRGFARGGRFWGPLVACTRGADVLAGACALPDLDLAYWAGRGCGCFRNGERWRLPAERPPDGVIWSLGELTRLLDHPLFARWRDSLASAASLRCYGDLASMAMLLDGIADVWVECGVAPWDLAPAPVLIEEAGGVFRDLTGGRDFRTGGAIAYNPRAARDLPWLTRNAPPAPESGVSG